jgi:hypothetical protein
MCAFLVLNSLQMELSLKLEKAVSNQAVRINTLEVEKIPNCSCSTVTKYGPTVLLSIKDKPYNIIKVFLPKRYSAVFSEDVQAINLQKVTLHLVYKGVCDKSKSYILGIEE